MINNPILAINFEYTLLEFYKKLSLNEQDVIILFMIKHLLEQNNTLITAELLSIKMNIPLEEIDKNLVTLVQKRCIEYTATKSGLVTSLRPLEIKLSEMYQLEVNKDMLKNKDDKLFNALKNIYEVFEKELGRTLSPVELSLIDEWVANGISENKIIDALHETLMKKKSSLRAVDRVLMKWQMKEDVEKEGRTLISPSWNKDIDKTLDIAQNKWGNKDEN